MARQATRRGAWPACTMLGCNHRRTGGGWITDDQKRRWLNADGRAVCACHSNAGEWVLEAFPCDEGTQPSILDELTP